MKNDNSEVTAVEKLRRLVMNRYGKGLMFRQLVDLNKIEKLADHQLRGLDLYIPLRLNDEYLGTAIVPEANDLGEDQIGQLSQLVKMAMEPALYSDFLERKESNLQQISNFESDPENVEALEEAELSDLEDESDLDLEDDLDEKKQNLLLTQIIHLSGQNENNTKKIAHQIHEMTHRWAFVPMEDMASQIHSVGDLLKLGAMTIFVSRIEKLDSRLQEILVEYLSEERTDQDPLILTCSSLKVQEFEQLTELNSRLKDEIMINTFEVDRAPFSSPKLKEVIELFFFRPT